MVISETGPRGPLLTSQGGRDRSFPAGETLAGPHSVHIRVQAKRRRRRTQECAHMEGGSDEKCFKRKAMIFLDAGSAWCPAGRGKILDQDQFNDAAIALPPLEWLLELSIRDPSCGRKRA